MLRVLAKNRVTLYTFRVARCVAIRFIGILERVLLLQDHSIFVLVFVRPSLTLVTAVKHKKVFRIFPVHP